MILIFSNTRDKSTNDVIHWLLHYNYPFKRINGHDKLVDFNLSLNDKEIELELFFELETGEQEVVRFSEIDTVWYRRGTLNFEVDLDYENLELKKAILKNLNWDWTTIKEFIFFALKSKRSLGYYYHEVNNNKLINLMIAQQCGLQIPNSLVSTQKAAILNIVQHKSITKCLKYGVKAVTEKERIEGSLTKKVTASQVEFYDDSIAPSFLQEMVDKFVELRVFFFKDRLFPMAIFSQGDKQTALDFRNYNQDKPNRNIIYKLPKEIEEKIRQFTKKANLDTGSIDIILTPQDEYVFLEVNPVGQFGWVSFYCHYNLEKEIAKYLMNDETN
jgi:ATP-GRASP peptide maturase of grasp-with-spasm system